MARRSTVKKARLRYVLAAVLLIHTASACMETALLNVNYLSDTPPRIINGIPNACTCCGHCTQDPTCASFAYNHVVDRCKIYSSVATYAKVDPLDSWAYYVVPGKSGPGEFCRTDSDCSDPNFCRGRFCTTRDYVTCGVIFSTFGISNDVFTDPVQMYGWVNGEEFPMSCSFKKFPGDTMVFMNTRSVPWTGDIMSHNEKREDSDAPFSMLGRAEQIREAGTNPNYTMNILLSTALDITPPWLWVQLSIPRDQPVVSSALRPVNDLGIKTTTSGQRTLTPSDTFSLLYSTFGNGNANGFLTYGTSDPPTLFDLLASHDGRQPSAKTYIFIR